MIAFSCKVAVVSLGGMALVNRRTARPTEKLGRWVWAGLWSKRRRTCYWWEAYLIPIYACRARVFSRTKPLVLVPLCHIEKV